MAEPPSIDANEITDKGYINQRAVLDRRKALVERLFAPNDPEVIAFAAKALSAMRRLTAGANGTIPGADRSFLLETV